MTWFARLIRPTPHRLLVELAETVANDCHWEAWNCLVARAGTMGSTIEAQSYIRTRISCLVHHRAGQIIAANQDASRCWADPVAEAAIELVVTRLVGPMLERQSVRFHRRAG